MHWHKCTVEILSYVTLPHKEIKVIIIEPSHKPSSCHAACIQHKSDFGYQCQCYAIYMHSNIQMQQSTICIMPQSRRMMSQAAECVFCLPSKKHTQTLCAMTCILCAVLHVYCAQDCMCMLHNLYHKI